MAMRSSLRLTVGLPIIAALAGCASPNGDLALSPDPSFGEASRFNAAVQTINPTPVYAAGAAQPGDNAEKGADAVERYRTGEVKDVEVIQTTSSPK
jgi:hypothetical protein